MSNLAHQFDVVTESWASEAAADAAKLFLSTFLDELDSEQSQELYLALFDNEFAMRLRRRRDIPPRVYELYESAVAYARKFGDLYGMPVNENEEGNLAYVVPVLH